MIEQVVECLRPNNFALSKNYGPQKSHNSDFWLFFIQNYGLFSKTILPNLRILFQLKAMVKYLNAQVFFQKKCCDPRVKYLIFFCNRYETFPKIWDFGINVGKSYETPVYIQLRRHIFFSQKSLWPSQSSYIWFFDRFFETFFFSKTTPKSKILGTVKRMGCGKLFCISGYFFKNPFGAQKTQCCDALTVSWNFLTFLEKSRLWYQGFHRGRRLWEASVLFSCVKGLLITSCLV